MVATGDDATFTTLAPVTFSTGSATAVGPGEATLTGTVNPSGYDTWYSFEWGGSTAYGLSTPQQDAGSGTTDVAVSATIRRLSEIS